MKLSIKPTTAPKSTKIRDTSLQKAPTTFLDISEKYLRSKKSTSLPNKLNSKAKLQTIMKIYQRGSSEKLSTVSRNKSRSKSKIFDRNSLRLANQPDSTYKTPPSKNPYLSAQLSSFQSNHNNTKRLSLQSTQSHEKLNPSYFFMELIEKLQEINSCRMDTIFLSLCESFSEEMKPDPSQRQSNLSNYLFGKVFRLIDACHRRKFELKEKQLKKKCIRIEEGRSELITELNRNKLKLTILSQQLDESSERLSEVQEKLTKIQDIRASMKSTAVNTVEIARKLDYVLIHKEAQTSFKNRSQNPSSDIQTPIQKSAACINSIELLKRIRQLQRKEKELISVLCLLKKQGVNIEKAYLQIVQSAQDQSREDQQHGSHQSEDESLIIVNLFSRKRYKKEKLQYQDDSSQFADQSIISSIEAMSFNYEDKELEAEVFSTRRQYKCKKQMDPALKGKLKLDFRELYQESEDGEFATV